SPGSTRPPGKTHMPPAKASFELRRSIRVSRPRSPSRTRITVAAWTISLIARLPSEGTLAEARRRAPDPGGRSSAEAGEPLLRRRGGAAHRRRALVREQPALAL